MKIRRHHILITLVAFMTLFSSCGKDEGKVIPRKKLARIYAEMLVTDQWITSTPGIRQIADTSLVYEPILEKYGYDSKDYRKSIDKYMDDPERFARIFRSTVEILEARLGELKREQERIFAMARLPKVKYDFKISEISPMFKDEPYTHYYDSLDIATDSTTWMYKLVPVETADTLFDGLRIIIKDSVAVVDTIAPADSLAGKDSLKPEPLKIKALEKNLFRNDSLKDILKNPRKPRFSAMEAEKR